MTKAQLLNFLNSLRSSTSQEIKLLEKHLTSVDESESTSLIPAIERHVNLLNALTDEDRLVALTVIDLLAHFFDSSNSPTRSSPTGNIELKTLRKKRKDKETGQIQEVDYGPYAYVRIWTYDKDESKRKLKSIYLGREIAYALENNWITEQRVLAAYHTGQIDELKGEVKRYIDENETT